MAHESVCTKDWDPYVVEPGTRCDGNEPYLEEEYQLWSNSRAEIQFGLDRPDKDS